jgi:hypothetical protein
MGAIRAWKSGALLTLWALSGAGQTLPLEIQIVVYDRAEVGPKTLSVAQNLAGKILLASGVETKWMVGPISDLQRLGIDFSAHTPAECASAPTPSPVRVRVLARAPTGVSVQTLGFSLPCATHGIQVTIYADHVARLSETAAPTFSRVLGYAMAHELGHVLLHSAEHEDSGLMKTIWSKSDWQRAAVSIIPFNSLDARRIANGIQNARGAELAQLSPIGKH